MNKKRLKVIDLGDPRSRSCVCADLNKWYYPNKELWYDICRFRSNMCVQDEIWVWDEGFIYVNVWFWAMFQGCEVCGWLCFYFMYVDWDLLLCGDPAAIVVFVNHSEVLKYCIIFLLLLSRILKKTTMYTRCMYIIILVRSVTSI